MTFFQKLLLNQGIEVSFFVAQALLFFISMIFGFVLKMILKILSGYIKKISFIIFYVTENLRWWFLTPWIYYYLELKFHTPIGRDSDFHKFLILLTLLQVGILGFRFLSRWRENVLLKKRETDPSMVAAIALLSKLLQALFIILLVLLGLDNLGVDVKALIAGFGIGGIAIALAAQNVLGDLLASLSIVFDKPFVVGDFIVVGSERGTIEHIGIKTTRLRSISGEELIFSNKDLLESRVHNFKRMWKRRMVHSIGVVYSTPPDIIKVIPQWVEDIIKKYPQVEFDRAYFVGFGDSSLNFELVYFVLDSDYKVAAGVTQDILVEILACFNAHKVGFAFPTRTIHWEGSKPC
jgi:small-conductance mechanosensitive channel